MREIARSVADVKRSIAELKGRPLCVSVNKGRNKTVRLNGEIENLFPSVFTFKGAEGGVMSFAYADVICGSVAFDGL